MPVLGISCQRNHTVGGPRDWHLSLTLCLPGSFSWHPGFLLSGAQWSHCCPDHALFTQHRPTDPGLSPFLDVGISAALKSVNKYVCFTAEDTELSSQAPGPGPYPLSLALHLLTAPLRGPSGEEGARPWSRDSRLESWLSSVLGGAGLSRCLCLRGQTVHLLRLWGWGRRESRSQSGQG